MNNFVMMQSLRVLYFVLREQTYFECAQQQIYHGYIVSLFLGVCGKWSITLWHVGIRSGFECVVCL